MPEENQVRRQDGGWSSLLLPRGEAAIHNYAQSIERAENSSNPFASTFQTIDTKASGVLTHVSMMIAGIGLCIPFLAQHPFEEAVLVGEIAVYLMIAVGCLRCLSLVRSFRPAEQPDDLEREMRRELVLRHKLYRFCIRTSIVFTTFVLLSLPLMWWWDPSR